MTLTKRSVNPAFRSPNTTTYIPIEKKTIFHGAPLMTAFIFTAVLLCPNNMKNIATTPAMIETGICVNSLPKYPITNTSNGYHEILNSFLSLIASLYNGPKTLDSKKGYVKVGL